MIRERYLGLAIVLAATSVAPALAEPRPIDEPPGVTEPALDVPAMSEINDSVAAAIGQELAGLPTEGSAEEIKERAALIDFYEQRANAPLWVTEAGLTEKAGSVARELANAGDWGLEPRDFALPNLPQDGGAAARLDQGNLASAEVALSRAILKYARHARGGRIIDPTILLNSNLDRKPQLLEPQVVIAAVATAQEPDAYLRGLHPKHPQFEKLRQAYLTARGKPLASKLLANMEEWRWMPEDLGDLHILANIPEFLVYLVKNGQPIHSERIVVGELGKQTTVFTRNLKTIVFKPLWRVPESIKVRELQPNLRRGGSMFRQYDLELETKDGQPLDYRSIDWSTADIRDYEVVQPPGRKNVMGVVKFTFPSQHTIFMHDTVDKWMFAQKQRTLSHGCLRLRNPMKMAELVLAEDKGWDAAHVNEVMSEGPRNNEIVIEKKIPVHLVYFTAWVDDAGKVRSFRDIYGHEKRITQALAGKWDAIEVGRDHLAPVEDVAPASFASPEALARARRRQPTIVDLVGSALGGGF
jgi:murein L,D-transpeptidase YcbB/YkuD